MICQGGGRWSSFLKISSNNLMHTIFRTLHTLADFSGPTARLPAPNVFNPIDPNSCSPRAILFHTYNRDMAALEAIYRWRQQPETVEVKAEESSEEEKEEMTKYMRSSPEPETVEEVTVLTNIRATETHTDPGQQLNIKRRYSTGLQSDFEEVLVKEEEVDEEDEKEEEMMSRPSSTETMVVPLKKRARMMEVPYAIGHVINKCVTPVMPFTFEEEFQVKTINLMRLRFFVKPIQIMKIR